MRRALAVVLLLAAVPGAAEGRVRGNGEKTTTRRDVAPFTAVRLDTSLDVSVKVGPARSVAVTIDSNLQREIETRVDSGTLVVDARRSLEYRGPAKVEITVPELRGFRIAGSGDVDIQGGKGDLALEIDGSGDLRWSGTAGALSVDIEGSGDVTLEGKADVLRAEIEGSGAIAASGLTARSADVEVDGSGDVDLTLAGGTLRAEVSGSGEVRWAGDATVEKASVSGSGDIARR
jgi:hypothetical protein